MKHIVCYSGGHSSALVGIEVTRAFGPENVVVQQHDIPAHTEDADIKRFKREVADHLGIPITYANYADPTADQFDICVKHSAFKVDRGPEICTARLKTEPFMAYLEKHHPQKDCIVYYGFDANETVRIQRRSGILGALGYRTDYPLALWPRRSIKSTEEIGIAPPATYGVFVHANCVGCLKAGMQHWYVVYCTRPDIWEKAKWAEEEIGYAIHHNPDGPLYLADIEPKFAQMKALGIEATERMPQQRFWARSNKILKIAKAEATKPCECVF